MRFYIFILILIFNLSNKALFAQVSINDSAINITLINLTANIQTPGGDMAERFGVTPSVGFGVSHKFASNFYGNIGFRFLLSGTVREDSMLRALQTSSGFIINDMGQPTEVRMTQAGFVIPVSVGKIFNVIKTHNPNSGFFVELGAQFIQHKINFQPFDGPIAALNSTNEKGYDRLTNGFGITEAVGYRYFSKSGYFNVALGFDFSQNFTQNRRELNWDTGMRDDRTRMDLLGGFRITWSWLIYDKAPPTYYFN